MKVNNHNQILKIIRNRTLYAVLILISISITTAYSQNIATEFLVWKVSRTMVIQSGEMKWDEDTIISYGKDSVDWISSSAEARVRFKVDKIIGSWDNINSNGYVTMSFKSGIGNITFEKTIERIGIRLIKLTSEEPEIYEFEINSVNPL